MRVVHSSHVAVSPASCASRRAWCRGRHAASAPRGPAEERAARAAADPGAKAARPRRPARRAVPTRQLPRGPALGRLRRARRDRRTARRDRRAAARTPARPPLHVRRTGAARIALLRQLRPSARLAHRRRGHGDRRAPQRMKRREAVAAIEGRCPRCGAARQARQEYCVECGLQLLRVRGAVPALRRRWVRRLGWYPGDWVWVSLLTLLV